MAFNCSVLLSDIDSNCSNSLTGGIKKVYLGLKENLTLITDGIDRLKQLKPKRFNFIGETQIVDGFVAHEAKEVVPESVTGEKDEVLPNGDPVYQGIDQAKIVPLLTAALQEAVAKIEDLENRIQTLENK